MKTKNKTKKRRTRTRRIDARDLSHEEYVARLQQLGMSPPTTEKRLQPPKSPEATQRGRDRVAAAGREIDKQKQVEQWRRARNLRKTGIDGRSANPTEVRNRLIAMGIDVNNLNFLPAPPPQPPPKARKKTGRALLIERLEKARTRVREVIAEAERTGRPVDARQFQDPNEFREYLRQCGLDPNQHLDAAPSYAPQKWVKKV